MPIEGVNIIREERPNLFLILPSQLAPPLELTNITDYYSYDVCLPVPVGQNNIKKRKYIS